MNDWVRSVTVLGVAFLGVVVMTLGFATLILRGAAGPMHATKTMPVDAGPAASAMAGGVPTRVGGTLTVSGDREGSLILNRGSLDGRFGLIGQQGRIFFDDDPVAVAQLHFDGLTFFPEPDECTITPGELNAALGIAWADLECAELADVRGNGVVTTVGTIGLPADLLGLRGDLPSTGGTLEAGAETWVFTDAVLFTGPRPAVAGASPHRMELYDPETDTRLAFTYDLDTRQVALSNVERSGRSAAVADDACAIDTRDVGALSPQVSLIEMSLECAQVKVPDIGRVRIAGSLFVERTEAAS